MKSFESLTEREVLALAITLEEEDSRIYDAFAEGLREQYPTQADKFRELRQDEEGHASRLRELYHTRFGDHVTLIRREDVRGFIQRRPIWLTRPLSLKAVRKQAALMEMETARFYEAAGAPRRGPGCPPLAHRFGGGRTSPFPHRPRAWADRLKPGGSGA